MTVRGESTIIDYHAFWPGLKGPINVIAHAGVLQSSTEYVFHSTQGEKISSFQKCEYMNFPPEIKPL